MTDTAIATRDNRPPLVVLRDRLETRKGELRKMLTDIPPENFIRAVITSATLNPDILACRWPTVWDACVRACRDNLLPDGVDAAIVPFKDRATYIPMYQGLLRRFRRSGQFKWITANVVRQGEEFVHFIDETGEHFRHVPGEDFSAPITKIYAIAMTKDTGGVFVTVLSIAEANKIRNQSRAIRDDSPWKQWPEEMYRKTALRRLAKYLPSARDLLADEDLPEIETTSPTALSPPGEDTPPAVVGERGGEWDEKPSTVAESAAREDAARPAAADPAYQRGKMDKAAGHHRTALPDEYRGSAHKKEADQWFAGYDGRPISESDLP